MNDEISICGLRVWSHVGITPMEQAAEQLLEIDIVAVPVAALTGLEDNIERTINYDVLRDAARFEAARKPRNLLETLAQDIILRVAASCAVAQVSVVIRKFVHGDCRDVGIRITRRIEKEPAPPPGRAG